MGKEKHVFYLLAVILLSCTSSSAQERWNNEGRITLHIAYPSFYHWTNKSYDDYEFHGDSLDINEGLKYDVSKYDSTNNKIYLADTTHTLMNFGPNRPMAISIGDSVIFTFWLIHPRSEYSCNWVVGLYNESDNSIDLQLGYPSYKFKYKKLKKSIGFFTNSDSCKGLLSHTVSIDRYIWEYNSDELNPWGKKLVLSKLDSIVDSATDTIIIRGYNNILRVESQNRITPRLMHLKTFIAMSKEIDAAKIMVVPKTFIVDTIDVKKDKIFWMEIEAW